MPIEKRRIGAASRKSCDRNACGAARVAVTHMQRLADECHDDVVEVVHLSLAEDLAEVSWLQ